MTAKTLKLLEVAEWGSSFRLECKISESSWIVWKAILISDVNVVVSARLASLMAEKTEKLIQHIDLFIFQQSYRTTEQCSDVFCLLQTCMKSAISISFGNPLCLCLFMKQWVGRISSTSLQKNTDLTLYWPDNNKISGDQQYTATCLVDNSSTFWKLN